MPYKPVGCDLPLSGRVVLDFSKWTHELKIDFSIYSGIRNQLFY
jgi:hypothetical protein